MDLKKSLIIHKPILDKFKLTCSYSTLDEKFTNSYDFPIPINESRIDDAVTKKLSNWVSIISSFGLFSVEYFDELMCEFPLSNDDIAFFEKLIYLGFGEFRYVNNIPMTSKTKVRSSVIATNDSVLKLHTYNNGPMLLNGGGKDGSVSAWLLETCGIPFTWFQRGESMAQTNVTASWSHPVVTIKRNLDSKRMNRKYAGHRPMSAGIAFVALLTAHIYEHSDVIASNEASANEGNLTLDGFTLNHQYSKSLEFEKDIQSLLGGAGICINYFSLLRPLHEIQIAKIAANLTDRQLGSIISCNNGTKTGYWCLKCAKCAFVALVMTAIGKEVTKKIWRVENVLNTLALRPHLIELLDPKVDKPLECVGTLEECQLAAKMIVDSNQPIADNATLYLLRKYAKYSTLNATSFMTNMSESNIPESFSEIITAMRDALSQ